jgi:hypothetical protein
VQVTGRKGESVLPILRLFRLLNPKSQLIGLHTWVIDFLANLSPFILYRFLMSILDSMWTHIKHDPEKSKPYFNSLTSTNRQFFHDEAGGR